jgi:hypothetical protein
VKVLKNISSIEGVDWGWSGEEGAGVLENIRPGIEEEFSLRIEDWKVPIRVLDNRVKVLNVGDEKGSECACQIRISGLAVARVVCPPNPMHVPAPRIIQSREP